jgi:hypothetical protein
MNSATSVWNLIFCNKAFLSNIRKIPRPSFAVLIESFLELIRFAFLFYYPFHSESGPIEKC